MDNNVEEEEEVDNRYRNFKGNAKDIYDDDKNIRKSMSLNSNKRAVGPRSGSRGINEDLKLPQIINRKQK